MDGDWLQTISLLELFSVTKELLIQIYALYAVAILKQLSISSQNVIRRDVYGSLSLELRVDRWTFSSPLKIIKQLVDLEAFNNDPCKNFLLKILVLFNEIC